MNELWSQFQSPGARFFASGEVRLAILSLLSEAPKSGYELMKELRVRSGGSYRMSAGTVYPVLQQLEQEALIVPDPKGGKKLFKLTQRGRGELKRKKPAIDDIWTRASSWESRAQYMTPATAMISGPLGSLMRAAFQAANRAGQERISDICDILARARQEIEEL